METARSRERITAERALEFLQDPDMYNSSQTRATLDTPWDLTASELLGFADADLASGSDPQALVNALSNAKRALHCQVDSVLYALGLHRATRKLKFPEKLDVLAELGVVTRDALARVNQGRNVMEHEHAVPRENEVKLFTDIVALFIEATGWYVAEYSWDFHGGGRGLTIEVEPDEARIRLDRETYIAASHPLYSNIVAAALRLARE